MIRVACGTLYMVLSQDPECFETEIHLGKGGSCQKALLEVIQGLLTVMRRQLTPIPRKLILKQLRGIRCENDSSFLPSCAEGLYRLLKAEWNIEDEGETNDQ
jgi:hypothetical protein